MRRRRGSEWRIERKMIGWFEGREAWMREPKARSNQSVQVTQEVEVKIECPKADRWW